MVSTADTRSCWLAYHLAATVFSSGGGSCFLLLCCMKLAMTLVHPPIHSFSTITLRLGFLTPRFFGRPETVRVVCLNLGTLIASTNGRYDSLHTCMEPQEYVLLILPVYALALGRQEHFRRMTQQAIMITHTLPLSGSHSAHI